MDCQSEVYSRLGRLKSPEDAAKLFSTILNYDYTGKTLSTKRFPSSLDGQITQLQILAAHDDFKVVYCEVNRMLLGLERPIISNMLRDHPYALFLFSDTSKRDWHFINVKYDEEESRRKIFRRIVVGPDERLHTAAQRIAMLEVPEQKLSPLELQQRHDEAFDVEAVTKEFFKSFATMFGAVKEEIEGLNPRYKAKAAEFSQMLLDRLMFLYFIQKKGWLDNNPNYLYERFRKRFKDQPEKHNYYTDIILRVFQRLAFADLQFKDLGSLPFLNGGLFEIDLWEPSLKLSNGLFGRLFKELFEHYNFTVREDTAMDMEVAIDPEMLGKVFENLVLLREKAPTTDLRKATGSYYTPRVIVHFMSEQSLKEYLIENAYEPEGFGLRKDVLQFADSAYEKSSKQITFDAPQQDVLRKQIRGKIDKLFTLNPAGQLTDDEVTWLKSAFTIEEAQRLKTLILNCRVCDPAVGSGAFVVGMLHVMVAIIKLLDVRLKGMEEIRRRNYDYELKRKIIEYCLYGVDIQEQAVKICELRLWLSLVVDYEGSDIPPLPNLSYRIRQGNSLIDQLFGYNVNLNLKAGSEKGEKLKQLVDSIQNDKHAYFYESDINKKHRAELGILAKQCDLALYYLKLRQDQLLEEFEAKYSKGLFDDRKLKKAEEEKKQALQGEMKALDKLMLRVKNTKDKIVALEKRKLSSGNDINEIRKQFGFTFVWRLDFAEVFKEKNGFDIIIENPPYGIEFLPDEKDLLKHRYGHIVERIRNSYLYFTGLSYDLLNQSGCMSLIIPNEFLFQIYMTKARTYFVENARVLFAINVGENVFDAIVPACITSIKKVQRNESGDYSIPVLDLRDCKLSQLHERLVLSRMPLSSSSIVRATPNYMFIFDVERTSLVTKLSALFPPFENYCDDVANGICTSCDEVYIITKAQPKAEQLEPEYLKPSIRGSHFNRFYCPADTGELVLYVTDQFNASRGKNILGYVSRYKSLLIEKCVEKKNGAREWHVLFRARYPKLFDSPKIVIRQTADRIIAALDLHKGYYCINSVNVVQLMDKYERDILFFLGLLNSKLLNFYYREISQELGRVLAEVKPQRIRTLPICEGDEHSRQEIMELVQAISQRKARGYKENTQDLERELDRLVYKLYGLNQQEIQLIEERA